MLGAAATASVAALVLSSTLSAQIRVIRPLLGVPSSPSASTAPSQSSFFDDSALQELRLEINSKDWQTLKENYLSNAYYPADLRWGNEVVRNIGIRSRGTASRSGEKPGLRVDFDRYTTSQTFLGLKSFVLRNNTTDQSGMHERVSMHFFERMGRPAPREAHTRLYVNGAYAGLYTIVEAIDKTYLGRIYGENDGRLIKFDRNIGDAPYYFGYLGPDEALYVPHPFKPETHESDPQPAPIVEWIRIIEQESEPNFRAAIAPYVDLEDFVRLVAIEVFLDETDGQLGESGMNNFYLYRPPGLTLHRFLAWDKSETFHTGPTRSVMTNLANLDPAKRNQLMVRALKWDDLRALYYRTLIDCATSADEVAAGDGRGWLLREIEREFGLIEQAMLADPDKPFSNDQFYAAVDALRDFAARRSAFVRDEVAALQANP